VTAVTCPRCNGTGFEPLPEGLTDDSCVQCSGAGIIEPQTRLCEVCAGLADVGYGMCTRCRAGSDEP
jgi:DnaJ-class molecular chaperone